ncbi:MAG: hypothetical protein PHV21_07990, partial [Synergistaceae bacterium]|nr:hypothetical protein [Synergistaceae bacterium]
HEPRLSRHAQRGFLLPFIQLTRLPTHSLPPEFEVMRNGTAKPPKAISRPPTASRSIQADEAKAYQAC